MPENSEIKDLLDRVPAGKATGKYLEQLSENAREVLEDFERWLREEDGKAESTSKAYKGYVAMAMVETEQDPEFELSTDVKSAIGALRRYKTWADAEYSATDVELDEVEVDAPESGDAE